MDPLTKGHVIQRMRNPQIAMVRYVQPKGCLMTLQETTTPIDKKFQDNIWTTKMCPAMQYCDVITNPRWRAATILKIAKSRNLSEKASDFDKI